MELLRSEDMEYVSLTMTNEAAHRTIKEIGKLKIFHPVDLGAGTGGRESSNKQHAVYKRRVADCTFWIKKLNSFLEQMSLHNITCDDNVVDINSSDVIEGVDNFISPIEKELALSVSFQKDNLMRIAECLERKHVLQTIANLHLLHTTILDSHDNNYNNNSKNEIPLNEFKRSPLPSENSSLVEDPNDSFRKLIVGVVAGSSYEKLSRAVFRVSRGNAIARFIPIEKKIRDPQSEQLMSKSVFYIHVIGSVVNNKVIRICESLDATVYPTPASTDECLKLINQLNQEITDKHSVHDRTEESIVLLLQNLASAPRLNNNNEPHFNESITHSPLKDWISALVQEKAICTVLMKAHYYLTMVALEGWVPSAQVKSLKQAAKVAVAGTGIVPAAIETSPANPIKKPGTPPTFFRVNAFTGTFQAIVDTYGVPRYKEINPGLFTIITFPFLFGVMYGDIGHGSLLTMFALAMVLNESKIEALAKKGQLGEIPGMAYGGRYALLLMGAFAVYCGIIYNDCFSISLNLYGSSWVWDSDSEQFNNTGSVYPLGLDPEWAHKLNELAFYNSFKMKMSVSLGVTQMIFGILLSLMNHLYFGDMLSVWFEFVPRMVFMLSTFGYMIWMILYKWCQDWSGLNPPNLIQTMIAMFLNVGTVDPSKQLYSGQAGFQTFLVFAALLSVPVMLLAKPILKRRAQEADRALKRQAPNQSPRSQSRLLNNRNNNGDDSNEAEHEIVSDETEEHEEHSFGDEMIHQAIHTIEFVLGAVSNTASYLRLWALSLAHAELSQVFWDKMIMQYGIQGGSGVGGLVGFAIWATATFSVLLCMDVLECFLHALRLHWVEFQGKFYSADGIAFDPFSLDHDQSIQ